MLIHLIIPRMWRERYLMFMLLLAMSLVCGFLALQPLFLREISETELEVRLSLLAERYFQVDLEYPRPIASEIDGIVQRELGNLAATVRGYTISERICTGLTPCYQLASYREFDDLFTLENGDLPRSAIDSRLELVITGATSRLKPSREWLGATLGLDTHIDPTIPDHIVGIVEPNLPEVASFWVGQESLFGQTEIVGQGMNEYERFTFFALHHPDLDTSDLVPDLNVRHFLRIMIDSDQIDVADLDGILARFEGFKTAVRHVHPEIIVRNQLQDFVVDFQDNVSSSEGPLVVLAVLVVALMLYNLLTTVMLVLEKQNREWALFASRGSSVRQQMQIQLVTALILGLIAAIIGPLLALGMLALLAVVGPQAAILQVPHSLNVPTSSVLLSSIAALAATVVLTIAVLPTARHGLIRLKLGLSRPPVSPRWARYYLDGILLIVGFGFMWRFISLINTGEGTSLFAFLTDPALLTQTIADDIGDGGFNDPFTLLGPVMLVGGVGLLWMRVFPLVMRLIGHLLRRNQSLAFRLALWNLERDPVHYGQLVLLLIGTLAIGTASLTMTKTAQAGMWDIAHHETGADLRVTVDPQTIDREMAWSELDGVSGVRPLLVASFPPAPELTLFGVQPESLDQFSPQIQEMLHPLAGNRPPERAGLPVPADAARLEMDVFSVPGEDNALTNTAMVLRLADANSVRVDVAMHTDDPTIAGRFVTFGADLAQNAGIGPWQIIGLRFASTQEQAERFEHQVYLDNLVAVSESGEITLVNGFEPDENQIWTWTRGSRQVEGASTLADSSDQHTEGEHSFRVFYQVSGWNTIAHPTLEHGDVTPPPIPIVVSPAFASRYGLRTQRREPLKVGDQAHLTVDFISGSASRRINLVGDIVGIVEGFPTVAEDIPYLVAERSLLQTHLNTHTTLSNYYDVNQIWLDMDHPEPTAVLKEALADMPGLESTEFAWDRVQVIQREPLQNGISGMFFTGFWVSTGLILLDFGFYLALTIRRRSLAFAVLRSFGWSKQHVWRLLAAELLAFVAPALLVGVGLGVTVAYLILPFMALIGGSAVQFPGISVAFLLIILVGLFMTLLAVLTNRLQQDSIQETIRLVE